MERREVNWEQDRRKEGKLGNGNWELGNGKKRRSRPGCKTKMVWLVFPVVVKLGCVFCRHYRKEAMCIQRWCASGNEKRNNMGVYRYVYILYIQYSIYTHVCMRKAGKASAAIHINNGESITIWVW